MQAKPCHHAYVGHLVPRKEQAAEASEPAALPLGEAVVLEVEILCHGEHQEHQHDVLAGAYELGIGKAFLIVEDKSADPA